MEGNLDAIQEIADQDGSEKNLRHQLTTPFTFYNSEKETFFSSACTLFSEILKIQINSLSLFFIQNAFLFLQFFASWFYSFLPLIWDNSTRIGKFILGLNCVLQFSKTNDPATIGLPSLIIPFVINLFIDVFFFSLLLVLKKRGIIAHQTSIVATFLFNFLLVVIYLPTFSAFASTFKFIVDKDPIAIAFFVMYIFVLGLMVILFKLLSRLICFPSNPTISQICTYNGQHIPNLLFFEGFKIVLVKITELYDRHFFILVFIVHVLFIAYQIYDLLSFPFVHFWCVPFFYGLYSGVLASDILTLVSLFFSTKPLITFLIPFVVFILGWIISFFIVRSHYNSIVEILDSKSITELERVRYYEQLSIKNVRQASKYIHIGFSKLIPSAIDGWLEILLARQFNDFDLWLLAGNLISFFPCNKAHLEECIEKLSNIHTSSTANRVLFIRLVRLLHTRDISTAPDKDDKLEEMKSFTANAINTVKTFWKDISEKNDRIPTSRIYSIAGSIDNAFWNWKEILSMYPNDPYLVENYSCFLVECLGKFKTGLKWKIKSNYLQNGYHAEIDPLFKSFLISMPRVWNDHMVDYFGHLQKDSTARNGTYEMMSAQEQLEKDIDSGAFDREAEKIFRWPRLRFCLTKAVSHYLPKGLRIFQIFKYLGFLAWFIVLIVISYYYSISFKKIIVHYEEMEYFHTIRIALSELRNIIFFNVAQKNDILFTDEIYHSFLPEKAFHESYYRTDNYLNSSDSFKIWSSILIDSFIQIYEKISDRLSDENISRGVESFLVQEIPRLRKKNTSYHIISNVSAKNAIVSLLWSYNTYSSLEDCESEYDNIFNSSDLYESLYLHQGFSFYFDSIIGDLIFQATQKCDIIQSSNKNNIIILIFIPLCVFVPFIIVPLIIIHRDTLKIFKLLKSVDTNSAKIASQKLSKISKFNIDYTSVNNDKSKSKTIIILIVFYTLCMVVPFILCILAYFINRNAINHFEILIDLSRFGNQREAFASELLGYLTITAIASAIQKDEFSVFLVSQMEIQWLIAKTVDTLNNYNSYFAHGYEEKKGIFSISSKIRDLHIIDKCSADLTQNDMHPFYNCIGLERLLSTYILYSSSFLALEPDSQFDMKSELFVNIVHLSSSELYRALNSSREYMNDFIYTTVNYSRSLIITLFSLSVGIVAINIIIDFFLQQQLLQSLHAVLVLLLHLPSPTIAENPSLFSIFLDRKSEEDGSLNEEDDKDQYVDPKQIIFNTTQTPIMCVGDGFIIETINKAFCNAFDYSSEQLVGKKLTAFIENPLKDKSENMKSKFREKMVTSNFFDQTDINVSEYRTENNRTDIKSDLNDGSLAKLTNEEKGAARMYQKMKNIIDDESSRSKYPIQCICGNDSIINTNVTVYPVRDNESTISNFILKIENNRQFKEVERKLEDAKSHFSHLQQQLIPRELDNFLKSKGIEDAFSANCVTVVAVRPIDPFDELNESYDRINELMQTIENAAFDHPPLMKVKKIFHNVFFIGGLFSTKKDNEEGDIIIDKKDDQNQNEKETKKEEGKKNEEETKKEEAKKEKTKKDETKKEEAKKEEENQNNNDNDNDNFDEFEISNENVKGNKVLPIDDDDNNEKNDGSEDNAIHANAAVEFAKDLRKMLNKILPEQVPEDQKNDSISSFRIGKSKFAIAITTGGPVVCCLTGDTHKSLEIIGDVMDEAFDLLLHAPPRSIIFKESTKKLLNKDNLEGIETGPEMFNGKTYMYK